MGVLVTLRRGADAAPFKAALLRLCGLDAGDLVLCTGYVWEDPNGYSILGDGLLTAIQAGLAGNGVVTVAGKLGDDAKWPYWETKYRDFILGLRAGGIPTTAYIARERNWHAKIALRLDAQGTPMAGIVGSSNLTGPAYRNDYNRWNYEADVLLWVPGSCADGQFDQLTTVSSDPFSAMLLSLSRSASQPDEAERLSTLYDDIFRHDEEGDLLPYLEE